MIFKLIFSIVYLIIIYLKRVKCSCEKEKPINKTGECQLIYCTENEFQNKRCSIDNNIIKEQWLNNIIVFDEYRYRFINMVINDKGDLILETSPEEINGQRLFFILTKNGKPYFKNDNNEEILSKSIVVLDNSNTKGALRNKSQIFLLKFNNENSTDYKQFLVSLSIYSGYFEIYDLDKNNITFNKVYIHDFNQYQYIIYSLRDSIIELNNNEYLYFFIGRIKGKENKHYAILTKYSFYGYNLNKINIKEKLLRKDIEKKLQSFSRTISAFKTKSNQIILFYIECFFFNEYYKYKVEILNETFQTQYEIYLENSEYLSSKMNSLFFKCIYLKENIGIFIYYPKATIMGPIITQ